MRVSSPRCLGRFLRNSCLGKWHCQLMSAMMDAQLVISAASCVRARCSRDPGWVLGALTQSQALLDGPPKRGRVPGGKSINPRCHQLAGWLVLRGRHRGLDLDLDLD